MTAYLSRGNDDEEGRGRVKKTRYNVERRRKGKSDET